MKKYSNKNIFFIAFVCACLLQISISNAADINIGGHAAITMFDAAYGTNDNGKGNVDTSSDYTGFRFLKCILFLKGSITDKISFDIRPQIETKGTDGTTGATPQFGKNIGEQRAHSTTVTFNDFTRATATVVLPSATELSVGYINSRFTWEYGNELFWEDEMNGSKFACNPWVGEFTDAGLELVHYFEIKDYSLPVYAYLLNGSGNEENNLTPVGMLAIEPSFGKARFHVSVCGGTWDSGDSLGMVRTSVGCAISYKRFSLRSEGTIGYWEKRINGSNDDAIPHGAYLKLFYMIQKKIRLCMGLNYVYNNFVDMNNPSPGEEIYLTLTPAIQYYTSASSRIILQCDLSSFEQNPSVGVVEKRKMQFLQTVLGWRFTF